jgi:ParB family chromosome partitioning protein
MAKAHDIAAQAGVHMKASLGVGSGGAAHRPDSAAAAARLNDPRHAVVTKFRNAMCIEVSAIVADPNQPRTEFSEEELHRMAESLKARGQLQPIRVRWDPGVGKYIILAGERRWRAAVIAGLTTLDCVVEDRDLSPAEILHDQVVENCLREDLKPIEQARAFQRLMEAKGWSSRQVAQELHLSSGTVTKALALLGLPEAVQELVEQGQLKPATAYEVAKAGSAEDQVALAGQVVAEGLTREQAVEAVKAKKAGKPAPTAPTRKEFKLDDGTRITVTGAAAAAGTDAVVAALKRALKQAHEEARTASRDQAA